MTSARSIKDVTKALQSLFITSKTPPSLPAENRRMLQNFIDEHHGRTDDEELDRANKELKLFWEKYVRDNAQRMGLFVGVLRELRQALVGEASIFAWYERAIKPVLCSLNHRKAAVEDAQEFLIGALVYEDDEEDVLDRARTSTRLCNDLLNTYIARTRPLSDDDGPIAGENAAIAQNIEAVLVAFGNKQPKLFVHSLENLIIRADTRLQALTLLNAFLRNQAPRLYQLAQTSLVEHLLRSLMNDTSSTVLSVALTSLTMLLPHIPPSLTQHLPRLFLVYSRLLCWEKFSPLTTEAQKGLVTDDRVAIDDTISDRDPGDVGIDPTWQKARPVRDSLDTATPELMTYFTYLYGLFPLNFMSYIRKPRKYLKQANFPGADDFDLDQAVIRGRSDQFRQAHFLHPNFYSLTIEEELIDPKWPKMEPSDVIASCYALTNSTQQLASPGPPPSGKLPDLPPMPTASSVTRPALSPTMSHISLRSGNSWRDNITHATSGHDPDSPRLMPRDGSSDDEDHLRPLSKSSVQTSRTSPSIDEFPIPAAYTPRGGKHDPAQNNVSYLQRENIILRNNLNFERWHKAQYSQHIGQMMKKQVKDATIEAETLNLINANRLLKQQNEQLRNAREATIKDSTLTRKQATNMEANAAERLNKMKKEQENWVNDADELRKLRSEIQQYRDLLSETEARELKKSHQLEMIQRDLDQLQKLQSQLQDAQRKVRDLEFREFDFDHAKRELEIVQNEKEVLQMKVQRHEQERERTRRVYAEKIAELEAQREMPTSPLGRSSASNTSDLASQQALADTQARLSQLKKAHTRLLERYTDLEMEYQSVKSQLELLRSHQAGPSGGLYSHENASLLSRTGSLIYPQRPHDVPGGAYGVLESVNDLSEVGGITADHSRAISNSDPSSRRYAAAMPSSPPGTAMDSTMHGAAGLTWKQAAILGRQDMSPSRLSEAPAVYNKTAPLAADERSMGSNTSSQERQKKEKIKPNSEVRVYGRGGAQNIKLKAKEPGAAGGSSSNTNTTSKSDNKIAKGFRAGFKGFV